MRPHDRESIQIEVTQRLIGRYTTEARDRPEGHLQWLINDTVFHELRRLSKSPREADLKEETAFYRNAQRALASSSERELRTLLQEMVRRFVAEVVGNFDERVYKVATTAMPRGLSLMFNAMSPRRLFDWRNLSGTMADHLSVEGPLEKLQKLARRGTLVVVPTHSSNMDSILLGYCIYLAGLPPVAYGAGLNLFTNPAMSFFMRNLGAYRVDRKKKATVYKDVLKEYATRALEMGYHQLFFPGGTRSRSGAVERHLKKGLLGTVVSAFVRNLVEGSDKPDVYVVPCTLSYKLTLEAETLIDDYLQATGQSRYIIEDDEFSKPRRILNFMSNMISLDEDTVVRFCDPLDAFGNRVDDDGNSLDPQGRPVDVRSYAARDGQPVFDAQRDREYTNELAEAVCDAYHRENVVMSTHLVGRAMFELLRAANPTLDLYRVLHTGGDVPSFTMADLHLETQRLLDRLASRDDGPCLSPLLAEGDIQEIVSDALTHFSIYHTCPALVRRGDRVFHEDRKLLLFYGNRLNGYGLNDASVLK